VEVSHPDGESVSMHNRHGSWIVQIEERMFEPEAVFGAETGRRAKFEASIKCSSLERKIIEATENVKGP
jgi:hypothetical protein